MPKPPPENIPEGFCQCGCGRRTSIPTETNRPAGRIKGVPMRFVSGHNAAFIDRGSQEEHLAAFLVKDPTSGCLNYTGSINPVSGYGQFQFNGQGVHAHRVAWLLAGREIPKDKPCVLHTCDNRRCCNLDHLFLGTDSDNAKDKARKQRGTRSRKGLPYGARVTSAGTYTSQVRIDGKLHTFGTYKTWQEASAIAHLHKNLALFPDTSVN